MSEQFMSGSGRNPLAWAFEFRPKIEDADWLKKVEFSDPRGGWCTYDDMEVRNIQPLYAGSERKTEGSNHE